MSASTARERDRQEKSFFVALHQIDPALDSTQSRLNLLGLQSAEMIAIGRRSITLRGLRAQTRNYTAFKFLSTDRDRPLVIRAKGGDITLVAVELPHALHAARVTNAMHAAAADAQNRSLNIACARVLRVLQRGPLLMIEETELPGNSLMEHIVELLKHNQDGARDAVVQKAFSFGGALLRMHALGFAHGELRLKNCRDPSDAPALGVSSLWRAVQLPGDRADLNAALRMYDLANTLLLLRKDMSRKVRNDLVLAMEIALLRGYFLADDVSDGVDDLARCARVGGTLRNQEGGSNADAALAVAQAKMLLESQYDNFWHAALENAPAP